MEWFNPELYVYSVHANESLSSDLANYQQCRARTETLE